MKDEVPEEEKPTYSPNLGRHYTHLGLDVTTLYLQSDLPQLLALMAIKNKARLGVVKTTELVEFNSSMCMGFFFKQNNTTEVAEGLKGWLKFTHADIIDHH